MKNFFIFLLCFFCNFFALCDDKKSNDEALAEIKTYLSNLKSLESHFEQSDGYGKRASGTFYLKTKKCKGKLVYNPPAPHVVTIKNNELIIFDRDLEEETRTSAYSYPWSVFSTLFGKQEDLAKYFKVTEVKRNSASIAITLCSVDEDQEGAMMCIFDSKTHELKGWVLFEKKNDRFSNFIEVILVNPKINQPISDDVFEKVY